MSALYTIRITSFPVATIRPNATPPAYADGSGKRPFACARIRHRYRAEFVGGEMAGQAVEGYPSADEALGALVRQAASTCENPDEVINFVASLFDNLDVHTSDETIGRALRFASRNRDRKHAGVRLHYDFPANQPPKPRTPVAERGGVA